MPSLRRSEVLREKEEVHPPMGIKELHHEARSYKSSTGCGNKRFSLKAAIGSTEGCTFSRKCSSVGLGKNRQAPRCSTWFQRTSPARADCFVVYFDSLVGVDEGAVCSRVVIEMGDQVGRDMRPQWAEQRERLGKHCWQQRSTTSRPPSWMQVRSTLVGDTVKAFERVRLEIVWRCARHFGFPKKSDDDLMWVLQAQKKGLVWFEGCVADPLQTMAMCRLGQKGRCCCWEDSCKKQ